MPQTIICPCGSNNSYKTCCEPLHNNSIYAITPEQLMRSRYSAYTLGLINYIIQTWHPSTCPDFSDYNSKNTKWIGLKIKKSWTSQHNENEAFVEFVARFRDITASGKADKINEISRFIKIENYWYYIDGIVS